MLVRSCVYGQRRCTHTEARLLVHGSQTKGKQAESGAGAGHDAARALLPFCRRRFSAVRRLWSPPTDPSILPHPRHPRLRPPRDNPQCPRYCPTFPGGHSRPVEGRGVAAWDPFLRRLRFTPASSSGTAGGAGGPSPRPLASAHRVLCAARPGGSCVDTDLTSAPAETRRPRRTGRCGPPTAHRAPALRPSCCSQNRRPRPCPRAFAPSSACAPSHSVLSDPGRPHGLQPARLLCP